MDEADEYLPQVAQLNDYTIAQMGGPPQQQQQQQQRYQQQQQQAAATMGMNPFEQQQQHQMMMMQQQHMQHMTGQQQQAPPVAAPPAPAKKPRAKSKKAQAAEAAAAAAAAAAANQMDPMASMAAMSNNPMMRQNAYSNQMGMYGGYQGANGPAQQGYRPGPAGAQGPYNPQNYQQMYHQRAAQAPQQTPAQPGYPYGYPPQGSAGYPAASQQAGYPPQVRHQYPPQGQQAPPGYWEGYPGYGQPGATPQPTTPAVPPATSQPMGMVSQEQWALQSHIKQLEASVDQVKTRIQQLYSLPHSVQADSEVKTLQHQLGNMQNDIHRFTTQLYQLGGSPYAPPPVPPTSSAHNPVHVNQSGNQVQLNITADKSRTLISVYHEGYGGSGASSTESKESIVPPEPTPSVQQQPPAPPSQPQEPIPPTQQQQPTPQPTPQVKVEQTPQPSYNGIENGVSGNPYSQQQQQQLYGQYPPAVQQPNMMAYPAQQPEAEQHASAFGIGSAQTSEHHSPIQMKSEPEQQPQQSQQYPGFPDYAPNEPISAAAAAEQSPSVADSLVPKNEVPLMGADSTSDPSPSTASHEIPTAQSDVPDSTTNYGASNGETDEPEQNFEEQNGKEEPIEEDQAEVVNNGHAAEFPDAPGGEEEEVETEMVSAGKSSEDAPYMYDDINNLEGEEVYAEEEAIEDDDYEPRQEEIAEVQQEEDDDDDVEKPSSEEPDDEAEEGPSSFKDPKEKDDAEDDDDVSSVATKDDFKEMSEAPSETNDGFTEPSTPATPIAATPSSKKKSSYRRPAVVVGSKSKKKKSFDDSDDDDFYPQRGKGKKKGGGGGSRKKTDLIGEEAMDGEKSGGSDDDEFLIRVEAPAVDPNALIVEKILNVRMHKVEPVPEEPALEEPAPEEPTPEEPVAVEPEEGAEKESKEGEKEEEAVRKEPVVEAEKPEAEEVEQFLIKWKGRSYMHCEWKTFAELLEIDKRVDGKIKRFKAKKSVSYIEDDEDFNADFVIVDRVVDHITEEDGQEFALIKWKSLGYDEVTWEPVEVVPAEKIEVWRQRQVIDLAKVKEKPRPEPEEWKKMSVTKVWKSGNSLREYQFEGVDWLLYCYYNAQNCILADEMGLGKTVQTITFLSQVYDYGVHGPFLIVVPLSTIQNWVREFETWTDMNAVVYHGSAAAREVLQQYEVFYDKRHSGSKNWRKNFVKLDALITTFETVVSDVEFLKKIPWRVCVIDEAHRLKNRNCKLLVNGLLAFRMEHRVLLTGTPLQNNIEELFSLLNFLHPQQFNNSTTFLEQFGSCQTDDQVQKLQEILKPMMLRRLKEDVEKSLGPKEETIIEVQLSDMQKKFYRAILERNFSHLCKGTSAPSLMNVMMELRKCCNHPFLINGAEETIMNDFRAAHPTWDEETLTHRALIQSSGKVVLIEKLLPKLRKDGHKVLIFSQMVRVLDILEEFLISMSYPFERIDGNVRGDLRQASIDRFSRENSDRFVFLLCTRAGGLGINLTAADTVIIFDSDWNPQNDLQAQARCHRIGQKKLVKVYRLITSNTYEREMFDKASLKLGLDKAVLQSTTSLKSEGTSLSKKDVEELLKKGAYGSIMDEENESAKFNEEDIETILQRRTQTITLEAGQKGSLFAKASFNSTHNKGDDIDLDDPEFWTKWAEKAQVDVEKATATPDGRELILEEPRKRTKRFEDNKVDEEDSDGSEGSGKRKRNAGASNRKRRKDDEDTDYSASYRPDELATSKAEYFKVEKVLAQFGWGRWADIKKFGELEIAEVDIEHMSRTLLLHCIREFRGDDRIRQFVFNLIKPQGTNDKNAKIGPSYNQGWAALPEFNPPSFALDSAFQRHVHRHANKLMIKIDMLKHLETHIIGDERVLVEDPTVKWTEIKLKDMPTTSEVFIDGWDADCDKCFLIGIWRHGLENYDTMRADETLCFHEKLFGIWPPQSDFWGRFRRLMQVSQRSVHDPVYEKLKWTKREEQEFMRVLRSFGIKEMRPGPGVDWNKFRSFAPMIEKKSDEECHEQLLCILAMCNRAQGSNDLKPMDLKRAMSVDPMNARRAARFLNRLHLMRKVHTLAEHIDVADLSLCETTGMPSGWSSQHDRELIEICDQAGLDQLAGNVLNKPAFSKIVRPSETTLVRRIIEIASTIEAGKWCGVGDVESVNDSDVDEKKEMAAVAAAQAQFLRLQQQQAAATAAAARKGGRKRPSNDSEAAKMRQLQQMMLNSSSNPQEYAILTMLMMIQPQLLSGSGSLPAAQQQQMNQVLALLLASAVQPTATTSGSSSKNSAANQQNAQMAALVQAVAAATTGATDAASMGQQAAVLETLIAMAAMNAGSMQGTSTPSTPSTKKVSKPAKEAAASSSASAAAAAQAAAQQAKQGTGTTQEDAIIILLKNAGIDVEELNILNILSKEAKIPMIHRQTKECLPESKRPAIKDLTVWVMANQEWILDAQLFGEMGKAAASSKRASAAATPAATPKPSTPKVEANPATTPTPSASATVNIKVGGSLQFDDMVSVFNRNTGESLAAAKWPKAKELAAWLDANPDCNVHSNSALIAHLSLGNSHADRIGGDKPAAATSSRTATSSAAATPGPSTATPSTSSAAQAAALNAAANAQLMALAAASAASQQTPATPSTSSSSKSRSAQAAAAAAAAAASHQEAITKQQQQQLEMIQAQLLMQQYQQVAAMQMLYSGYTMPNTSAANSTANVASMAAMAAAAQAAAVSSSTPSTSKQFQTTSSSTASSSSAAAAAAAANSAEDINPLLLSALMQNPAILQSMIMSDPSIVAALAAQAQQQQQPAAKKSKHP